MTTTQPTATGNGCPRGCQDPNGEDCKASLAIPCPQRRYDTGDSGRFDPACGCLERERCGGCGVCQNCDGCYCEED